MAETTPHAIIAGNIVLVGFMGTGKSAVGRELADRLRREFVDMDRTLETRAGLSVTRLFAERGEAHFRALEKALVVELAARRALVIACGGGVVLDADNIRAFARSGLVVCLTAAPEELERRVAASTHRPLLEQSGDKRRRIRELLEARRPFYDAVPCQVDTTGLTVGEIAIGILAIYEDQIASGRATWR